MCFYCTHESASQTNNSYCQVIHYLTLLIYSFHRDSQPVSLHREELASDTHTWIEQTLTQEVPDSRTTATSDRL